jgi:hypothetical protein
MAQFPTRFGTRIPDALRSSLLDKFLYAVGSVLRAQGEALDALGSAIQGPYGLKQKRELEFRVRGVKGVEEREERVLRFAARCNALLCCCCNTRRSPPRLQCTHSVVACRCLRPSRLRHSTCSRVLFVLVKHRKTPFVPCPHQTKRKPVPPNAAWLPFPATGDVKGVGAVSEALGPGNTKVCVFYI